MRKICGFKNASPLAFALGIAIALFTPTSQAHDLQTLHLGDSHKRGNQITFIYDAQCLDDISTHRHDANGNHIFGVVPPAPMPRTVPCPPIHSAAFGDRTRSIATQAGTRSQANESRIVELERQLSETLEAIEGLKIELQTVSQQLRQTQETVSTHREDFSNHRHDTDGVSSGTPYY